MRSVRRAGSAARCTAARCPCPTTTSGAGAYAAPPGTPAPPGHMVYSPTEADKKQDTNKIEEFYQKLQSTVDTAHKNLIIMGDFNGQIGECRSGEEYIVGRYGNGNRSKNGQHLVNFGLENKLSILNSFFKKKKNKKWTWTSPNGLFKNEIDYIMTNKPKVFKDLSVLHNLNFNSDHKMIRATLRSSHTKKSRRLQTGLTPYVDIKNNLEIMNNLKEFLERREQKEYNKAIEATYCYFVNTLKTVARKVSTNNKSILSTETIILLKERKLLLQGNKDKETRKEIAEISKNINKNIRKDRKQKRANTFQYHIKKTGGVKKAFKELESKKNWMPNIKDRQGRSTTKRSEILNIATQYYKELYTSKNNKPATTTTEDMQDTEPIPPILKEETERAITTQKLEKAPGLDQITNELLKTFMPVIVPKLTNLFNEIITAEVIPEDWVKSVIVLLHKKGDKRDINNYRPISLMSNIYKIFSKILLFRLTITLDENQPKEQAGFRSNFSTIDHIHVLRQILQKYREYNKTYYLGFVDFNKAFDSLEHHYIWESLEQQGVHKKYIRILKNIYGKSTAQIKLEKLGEEFPIERGVRQGDPISPKIFSAVLELIFRKLDWDNFGLNVNGDKLSHLRFADDLILFSECPMILERMLQQLADESANAGLTMNITKTKVMSNSSQKNAIAVNNQELEYVSEYVYLGQLVSPTESMQKEIERRIANTWKKFWSLSEVMKNKEMPMAEKRKVFNVCILPCLTYGCQTWALTEKQQNKLNICQNGIERSVLGVRRRDKIELKKIKGETKFGKVQSICRKLKWRWTGHMMREKKEKWTRIITEWYPRENKRIRGRQPKRWEDDLKQVAGPGWLRTAKDRSKWKSLEEAFVERQAVKRRDKPNAEICFSIS
ncbi:LINE-1 retrotransposable element ORF2 protein isoform X1 [Bombyx mori]|uniref:Reverse transcriptase domain-containing protein n=1 Tax=Bombyx mori TaxID=7091 RepID=A0A8R2R3D8_BOMMO|nr:uncharacterized protein LOC101736753 isoform X1 [Bombyx mori]